MNTEKLAQLIRERQAKQTQIRTAMNRNDFDSTLARIRERREIDERIAVERRSGKRIMICESRPTAH